MNTIKGTEMNKMAVVKWYDPDTVDSVTLAAKAYGIQIKAAEPTGEPNEAYICVFGPTESVDRFIEDTAEGDIEPFESKRELPDDEYQVWLAAELTKLSCFYIPKFNNKEDDNA